MYYLARNKEVVAEARQLFHPEIGTQVGKASSSGASFTTLGLFSSLVLGREVFVGVKKYRNLRDNLWKVEDRVSIELAIIAVIAEHIVEMREDLPSFYALLRGSGGKPVGILMEDFSKGGSLKVAEANFVPESVNSLFGKDVLDEDYICNMAFNVDGRIRYGDFYPFFNTHRKEDILSEYPMSQAIKQVVRNRWQHTFRLGRDLI